MTAPSSADRKMPDGSADPAGGYVRADEPEAVRAEVVTTPERRIVPCATTTPEPHERGEFPMTCYRCHVWADS